MSNEVKNNWKIWGAEDKYGELFYSRAISEMPEMECSKAVANIISQYIDKNNLILDVGCGAGHYLISLNKTLTTEFNYHGIDATLNYIELAQKAFANNQNFLKKCQEINFNQDDIFALNLPENYADIVMCNNVLLHLPFIEKPLNELLRVAKKYLIIRTLIDEYAFRIKQVKKPEKYDKDGEPLNFNYLNIYSKDYFCSLIKKHNDVKDFKFVEDNYYDPFAFNEQENVRKKINLDTTNLINGKQRIGSIIQPWHFIIIEKYI